MKVCGVICELNTAHNGHKYIFDKAREVTGADYLVAVMSGDFVQRGEPAIFDKHIRTKSALLMGADAVLEIPGIFATGSAQYFARGAVALLNKLGCVNSLVFGSETGELRKLNDDEQAGPNDILGSEYLKALEYLKSDIKPYAVTRIGTGYNDDENTSGNICSASFLRKIIESGNGDIYGLMPDDCQELIINHINKNAPVFFDDFSDVFFETLRKHKDTGLSDYYDIYDDLSDKLLNPLDRFVSGEDYCHIVKTKEVALAHIKRAMLHAALNYTKEDVEFAKSNGYYIYSRLLGFRNASKEVLSLIAKTGPEMISKTADYDKVIGGICAEIYRKDISASALYQYIKQKKDKSGIINEFTRGVIVL